jgi:hypothetical protein
VTIGQLVDEICAKAPGAVRLLPMAVPEDAAATVLTPDLAALVEAGTALVEAVERSFGTDAALSVEPTDDRSAVDLSVSAMTAGAGTHRTDARGTRRPIDVGEKGLGLSLLIASAVVGAHGGQLWEYAGEPVLGMTLPWSQQK